MRRLFLLCLLPLLLSCADGGSSSNSDNQTVATSGAPAGDDQEASANDNETSTSDGSDNETSTSDGSDSAATAFTLTSPAVVDGALQEEYQCETKVDGVEDSIPLAWSNLPSGTNQVAITMHEPTTGNTYLLLWGIDASVTSIAHGAADDGAWFMGPNKDGNAISYTSPCSQSGGTHSYTLTIYALSETPASLPTANELTMTMTLDTLTTAIAPVTLASATLTFTTGAAASSEETTSSGSDRCAAIQASITAAGFDDEVTVSCDGTYANLSASTYPAHDLMNGITGTNEQLPVPAKDYLSPIVLSPTAIAAAESYTSRDAALGVAVNGVPIYDYSAGGDLVIDNWVYQASEDTTELGQLDNCGGHAGRGDDYHYHKRPTCMIESMLNKDDNPIIGWAFDGYPIYGDNAPDGTALSESDLGLCNHMSDDTFGYRYHTSSSAPYILMCLVGETDSSKLSEVRVQPLPGRTSGEPITVTNLSYTTSGTSHTLSYTYAGEDYYLRYTPSTQADCYDFETKTVVNNGAVKTGTYCR
jgi:phosphatidylethanolamine-binding protein (PEBP) family uncharacterized protein